MQSDPSTIERAFITTGQLPDRIVDRLKARLQSGWEALRSPLCSGTDYTGHLPSLNGWRCLSILVVLGHHCKSTQPGPGPFWKHWLLYFDGNLAVRCFFVISGLLITHLLINEQARNGFINYRHFYVRRALRILPVYWAFLIVLGLLQCFTAYHQSASESLGAAFFAVNFLKVPFPIAHLWSLAIEEQFYLTWPFLFGWLAARRSLGFGIGLLLLPLLFAQGSRILCLLCVANEHQLSWIQHLPQMKSFIQAHAHSIYSICNGTSYFDSIAIGCLASLFLHRGGGPAATKRAATRYIPLVLGTTMILMWYMPIGLLGKGPIYLPFQQTVQALGFALLIFNSIKQPTLWPYRILNWPLVDWIGKLSFSLYIWQQIFCTDSAVFGWKPNWLMAFPTWMLSATMMAIVSFYCLERPLFRLRSRFR